MIAPSSYHRLRFRDHDKETLLEVSNRFTIAGLFALAVSITCVVFVISDFLYGLPAALPATIVIALTIAVLWYGLPFRRALQARRSRPIP